MNHTLWAEIFVLGVVLTNFRLLASSRLLVLINTMQIQAISLSAIPIALAPSALPFRLVLLAMITLAVKGWILPRLLKRAVQKTNIQREIEPFVRYEFSILLGIILWGLCFYISHRFKTDANLTSHFLLPSALFSLMTGLLIIVSRRKALTQVIGYLTMENGVYLFGAALAIEEPLLVEMGVLLDVFVAVFIMGITIYQINSEFDHIDTDRLSELKD